MLFEDLHKIIRSPVSEEDMYINPTHQEFRIILKESHGSARGLLDLTNGDVYAWSGFYVVHEDALYSAPELRGKTAMIYLPNPKEDNGIMISEFDPPKNLPKIVEVVKKSKTIKRIYNMNKKDFGIWHDALIFENIWKVLKHKDGKTGFNLLVQEQYGKFREWAREVGFES